MTLSACLPDCPTAYPESLATTVRNTEYALDFIVTIQPL